MRGRLGRAVRALAGAVGRRVGMLLDDLALAMLMLAPGGDPRQLDRPE